MKNFVQPGINLDCIAPYAVTSGQGFLDGAEFAVASNDAAQSAVVVGVTSGVFTLPTAAVTVTRKTVAYWDNTARVATNTSNSGANPKIGIFQASATSAAGAPVKLIPTV